MTARNGSLSEDPGKRQAILHHAIRTFAELGYRGTEVQVIADRAGVGKGTVYRYFGSKEDLFWATTYEVLLRLEQQVFAAMEGVEGACAKLRASAIAYVGFFEAHPECLEVFVQDRAEFRGTGPESHRQYHENLIRKIGEIMQQGIEAGELRPVDPRQTTIALGCVLYGTVVLGCRLESVAVMEMAEHAVDIFLQGLHTESSCVSRMATT
jgi:AcrR family transcriptional regulator